jgi:hypothetical protein
LSETLSNSLEVSRQGENLRGFGDLVRRGESSRLVYLHGTWSVPKLEHVVQKKKKKKKKKKKTQIEKNFKKKKKKV